MRSVEEFIGRNIEVESEHRAALDGVVPAKTTYAEWLKRQSREIQEEVLGPKRTELFRSDPFFKLERIIDS